VFNNNDIAQVREVTNTELVLHDARRMRRDGVPIDQGICITSHASRCRTVDQVVVLADGADAKCWYVSLSRARDTMHVFTRNKGSVTPIGTTAWRAQVSVGACPSCAKVEFSVETCNDARSVAARQAQIVRAMEMER
jgi:hypothetical protein